MTRVLIVGRPNVGKSSLFNRLVRKRKSLVVDTPGVTRDILKQSTSWWGIDFEVWDSGGLWAQSSPWDSMVNQKVQQATQQSDLIVLVMDGRAGYLSADKSVFRLVKKSGKPFLISINKIDDVKQSDQLLSGFYEMGVDILPCSFENDQGVSEIVEWISAHHLRQKKDKVSVKSDKSKIRVFVIGKTNAGKSSLCNVLLKQDRMITSHHPGTTTDVVEDQFTFQNFTYILSDTAGLRKLHQLKDPLDSLSLFKSHQSFNQADVGWVLIDGSVGPSRQDARLLQMCVELHKAVILVVNKWDLVTTLTKEEYRKKIQEAFHFYPNLFIVFTSALKQTGLSVLLKKTNEVYEKLNHRISTSKINQFFTKVIRKAPSPVYGSQDVKFYYLTQTNQIPPSFIAFANYPQGVRDSYRRFLIRQIQKEWNLEGIPVRIFILPKNK